MAFPISYGGTQNDHGQDVTFLSDGSAALFGHFEGTISFGDLTFNSKGEDDGFILKIDQDGNREWGLHLSNSADVYTNAIESLPDGSIIVYGEYEQTLEIGGTTLKTGAKDSNTNDDIFVSRISSEGKVVWAKSFGGLGDIDSGDIGVSYNEATDKAHVVIAGAFEKSITFGTTTLTSKGNDDAFTAKLDVDTGEAVWAKRLGGDEEDDHYGVAVLEDGSSVVFGEFSKEIDIEGYSKKLKTRGYAADSSDVDDDDLLVIRYDANGKVEQVKTFGFTSDSDAKAIAATEDGSAIYLAGHFVDFLEDEDGNRLARGDGEEDDSRNAFLIKLDQSLDLNWWRAYGSKAREQQINSVALLGDGSPIILGDFAGTIKLDSVTLTNTSSEANAEDTFIAKLNSNGAVQWVKQIKTTGDSDSENIAVSGNGDILFTGESYGDIEMGGKTFKNKGEQDIFLGLLDSNGSWRPQMNTIVNKLTLSNDNYLTITDGLDKGLWVQFKATGANATFQNSIKIVDSNNNILGSIGATSFSKNLGNLMVFIPEGTTFSFQQYSNNQKGITSPDLTISEQEDGSFRLNLNDSGYDTDKNDLIIDITASRTSPNSVATAMAVEQKDIHDAILDLSSISAGGQQLKLTINSDCAFKNRVAMVKLTQETDGSFSVNGFTESAGAEFDLAVKDHLINPGGATIQATGFKENSVTWTVSESDAGYYAPVVINPSGDVYSIGSINVKNLGTNFFAFEDKTTTDFSDWDYNDVTILVETV